VNQVFGEYATFYDAIYAAKDYRAECDNLERLFKEFSPAPVKSILDLGCGTGGHSLLLAQRGYEVTGVDRSEPMLAIARAKAARTGAAIRFVESDVRNVSLDTRFDAVISMFAVVSYLTKDEDLRAAFTAVHRHLKPGGIFYFDVWFGPGVLQDPPSERFKVIPADGGEIVRLVTPRLDLASQTVDVNYRVLRRTAESLADDISEVHPMRFFFPREINLLLSVCGLRLLSMHPEGRSDASVAATDWQVGVLATVA